MKVFLIVVICLVVAAGSAAYFGWNKVQAMLGPVNDNQEQFLINIPRGSTSASIGDILEEADLIHNSTLFRYWLRYHELDGKIQAGDYILSPSMSLEEIVDKLIRGEVHRETIRFTVPEGLFITDIAQRLEDLGLVDAERFIELANDLDRWNYWFIQGIPDDVEQPLEGYLFPDTYELFVQEEDKETRILSLMLDRFNQVFTQEWRERADEIGMSVHEVMTLASIVEKEAVVTQEQPVIARVFLNRLDGRIWPRRVLESCATVNYVLGDFSIRYLTTAQTRTPSPYNTYINAGLPPGPIAGAGQGAIRGVLYPAEVDYLFFVAKDDGTSEHYFGVTYADHLANIAKARANRNRR